MKLFIQSKYEKQMYSRMHDINQNPITNMYIYYIRIMSFTSTLKNNVRLLTNKEYSDTHIKVTY